MRKIMFVLSVASLVALSMLATAASVLADTQGPGVGP